MHRPFSTPRAILARQRLAPRWWAAGVAIAILYCVFLFPSPDFNLYNKDDASLFLTLGINLSRTAALHH